MQRKEVVDISPEEKIIKEIAEYANSLMADWPSSRNRQRQFVLEYVKLNFSNSAEAARRAGYAKGSANRHANKMLTNADFLHVQKVVENLRKLYEEKSAELSIASATEIKQYLTRVIRGEETDEEFYGVGDGAQSKTEVRASTANRIRAAELLGKSASMWTDKVDVNAHVINDGFDDVLEMLSKK